MHSTPPERSPSTPGRPPRSRLDDLDLALVADQHPQRLRHAVAAGQLHFAAQQAGLHAGTKVFDNGAGEDDRVLDFGAADAHLLADRGIGTDVGALDPRAGADHGRAADHGAAHFCAGLDHDPTLDPRVLVDLAVEACLELLEDKAVGLKHVGELAGVLPPAADHLGADLLTTLDQALDRLRYLQLTAPGRLQRAGGREDRRLEEVDADQGEVRRRVLRLLDQADNAL